MATKYVYFVAFVARVTYMQPPHSWVVVELDAKLNDQVAVRELEDRLVELYGSVVITNIQLLDVKEA